MAPTRSAWHTCLGFFFLALSAAATYVIQVIGTQHWNTMSGALDSPQLRCKAGLTKPMTIGVTHFDNFICILVSFFETLLAERVGWTFMILFGTVMSPMVTICFLEGAKWQHYGQLLSFAALPVLALGQVFTIAVTIPLYFSLYCFTSNAPTTATLKNSTTSARQMRQAYTLGARKMKSVYSAIQIGFKLPSFLMLLLPFLTPTYLSSAWLWNLLAVWQFFPVLVSLIATVRRQFIAEPDSIRESMNASRLDSQQAFQRTMKSCGIQSVISYYLVWAICVKTAYDSNTSLTNVVQSLFQFQVKMTSSTTFFNVAHFVLTMDCLFATLATLIFVVSAPGTRGSLLKKSVAVTLLSALIGPGGAICWAWYRREREMNKVADADSASSALKSQ